LLRVSGLGWPVLCVYASHSALQIVAGASEEGLDTLLFGPLDRLTLYHRFPKLKFRSLECSAGDCLDKLVEQGDGLIIIPNGSLVEYVGFEKLEKCNIPIFGLRQIMRWESRWELKMKLLKEAGLKTPRIYKTPEEVDRPVIVKLPGAKGGRGYFVSSNPDEIREKLENQVREKIVDGVEDVCIQEYIIGATMYAHYFYSPIFDRLEITGFDVRYESNVDGFRRAKPEMLKDVSPSFTVVGNFPAYPREALLEKYIQAGEKFVEATKKHIPPGIIGPFSLESVITDELDVVFFEFSGRIVAGTNVYLTGSPYLALYWGEAITVGRRIAKEIKLAYEQERLEEVLT